MVQHYTNIIFLWVFLYIMVPAKGLSTGSESENNVQQDTVTKQNQTLIQPVYTSSRLLTSRPVIDGKLNDECWKKGIWAGNYTQWVPKEGAQPTWPTRMNIQYDDKNIYVAFRCFDGEPEKILRMAGGRDEQTGDMVGINFDSYRDYRTGFEFNITAWGQKVDLILFNPMNIDANWNPVWKGKVGTEDSAWVAEMEIPLSQLRYSIKDEQVWGLHTWRWISRLQEESNWEKQSKTGPGMLYNFGELRGINGLKKSRRLEIMPFALGDIHTMKRDPGNPFTDKGRVWGGNMGLDAKIGISSNFTVDLTVNPDFGQVESDPSVMNLTAFETFYEEKRPFFLEGLTIFDYKFDNQSLFYSRRIGHAPSLRLNPNDNLFVNNPDMTTILSAAKLSGTTSKGLSVGFIQSVTANEYARQSDIEGRRSRQIVEPLTNYMVARIQKGFNAGNTLIGGILTSTNRFIEDKNLKFLSKDAYTGGLDILHHWKDKEYFVEARLIGSYVDGSSEAITNLQESSARYFQRPGAAYLGYDTTNTRLSGYGGKFRIGKGSRGFWRYSAGFTWFSPGLELNDLGFMNTADKITQACEVSYFVNQPVSIFRTYTLRLEQFSFWNFNSDFLGAGSHFVFTSEFKNQWSLVANLRYQTEALDTKILRGGYDMITPGCFFFFGNFRTDPSKKIIAHLEYNYEKSGNNSALDYELAPGISYRPVTNLKIGLTANYIDNYNRLQYVKSTNFLTERRYILGTIDQKTLGLTFRVDLNLTPEFSIQYYGSPFVSRGKYSEFKRVVNPEANVYNDRFSVFNDNQIFGNSSDIDENNDRIVDYTIGDPDFNFHEFRSNLVAKWEYRLGSFIYLVWSSERTANTGISNASITDSYKQLFSVYPKNIFLVKLNYWFSL